MSRFAPALTISAALLAGCSGADVIGDHDCPPEGTTLTYDNFGEAFFERWCVYCHGGANSYSSRSFTSVDVIRSQRERIYANAAAGNTSMPPGPDDPSEVEREQLAEWLACGAP